MRTRELVGESREADCRGWWSHDRYPKMISALLELVARCTEPEAVRDVLRPLHTSVCDFTANNPSAAANAASVLSCDHWLEWFLSFLAPVRLSGTNTRPS